MSTPQEDIQMLFDLMSPAGCLKLYWCGRSGKLPKRYWTDTIADRELLAQFMVEAGVSRNSGISLQASSIDAIGAVAGKYGYSLEIIGEDDTCTT